MTYSAGGTIEATDYNTRIANINAIWGVGAGSNGYGQSTTLSNVTSTATVSATNWASAIARLDSIRNHQSGVTSGITQPTAGNTVQYLSALDTQISTIITNKLSAATRGTAAPTGVGGVANATAWSSSATKEITATWSSTDTVRYFFNAGGRLTWYYSVVSGTTTKATDWNTFLTNTVGTITLGSNYCSRSGTGGDGLTQNTGVGYYNLTSTYQTLFIIGSTSATADYGLNYITIQAKLGATANIVAVQAVLTDAAADTFNDTVNGTTRVDMGYTPPETTYLSNVWGAISGGTGTNTQS